MSEVWKPIVDVDGVPDGVYEFSSHGRVRSLDRIRPHGRWQGKTQLVKGRVLKPFTNGNGYQVVCLYLDDGPKKFYVHRLVLIAFCGLPPQNCEACHADANKSNNHIDNLRWGSKSENYNDKIVIGFCQNGERNAAAKLTSKSVGIIRRRYANGGVTQKDLADQFGVAQSTISAVISGKIWGL